MNKVHELIFNGAEYGTCRDANGVTRMGWWRHGVHLGSCMHTAHNKLRKEAMKFKVRFTATFETEIEVPEGKSISDFVSDIDIPESKGVKYCSDSFEVDTVQDETGKFIDIDE